MKKIISVGMSVMLCAGILSGCSESNNSNSDTSQTNSTAKTSAYAQVTIENNGKSVTYTEEPERVVVLSYDTAEIMAALGLADKVVALAPSENSLEDVSSEYRDDVSKIPVFKELNYETYGVPSLEVVLAETPDLIYGLSYSFTADNVGELSDYDKNNINVYITEGTCVNSPALENTYNDILNISKIFGVEENGKKLVEDLRNRASEISSKVTDVEKKKVFVYDSGDDSAFTVGGNSLENEIISIAGGENIFSDVDKAWTSVSWENVMQENPDVIIVHKWTAADDAQAKIDILKNMPELADVTAIKENNFIVISLMSALPSLQNVNALQTIAEGLHPESFN